MLNTRALRFASRFALEFRNIDEASHPDFFDLLLNFYGIFNGHFVEHAARETMSQDQVAEHLEEWLSAYKRAKSAADAKEATTATLRKLGIDDLSFGEPK